MDRKTMICSQVNLLKLLQRYYNPADYHWFFRIICIYSMLSNAYLFCWILVRHSIVWSLVNFIIIVINRPYSREMSLVVVFASWVFQIWIHILQEVSYLHRILSQTLVEVDVQTIFRYSSSFSDLFFLLSIYQTMLSLYSACHIFIFFFGNYEGLWHANFHCKAAFRNADFYPLCNPGK